MKFHENGTATEDLNGRIPICDRWKGKEKRFLRIYKSGVPNARSCNQRNSTGTHRKRFDRGFRV